MTFLNIGVCLLAQTRSYAFGPLYSAATKSEILYVCRTRCQEMTSGSPTRASHKRPAPLIIPSKSSKQCSPGRWT